MTVPDIDLPAVMASLDWSNAELARRVEVHPNTVSKWITGETRVPGGVRAYLGLLIAVRGVGA